MQLDVGSSGCAAVSYLFIVYVAATMALGGLGMIASRAPVMAEAAIVLMVAAIVVWFGGVLFVFGPWLLVAGLCAAVIVQLVDRRAR